MRVLGCVRLSKKGNFAEKDAKNRKRSKKKGVKKKSKSPGELEEFNEFLDKLCEIRRSARFIFS